MMTKGPDIRVASIHRKGSSPKRQFTKNTIVNPSKIRIFPYQKAPSLPPLHILTLFGELSFRGIDVEPLKPRFFGFSFSDK